MNSTGDQLESVFSRVGYFGTNLFSANNSVYVGGDLIQVPIPNSEISFILDTELQMDLTFSMNDLTAFDENDASLVLGAFETNATLEYVLINDYVFLNSE